jgi:hypothetical protein
MFFSETGGNRAARFDAMNSVPKAFFGKFVRQSA